MVKASKAQRQTIRSQYRIAKRNIRQSKRQGHTGCQISYDIEDDIVLEEEVIKKFAQKGFDIEVKDPAYVCVFWRQPKKEEKGPSSTLRSLIGSFIMTAESVRKSTIRIQYRMARWCIWVTKFYGGMSTDIGHFVVLQEVLEKLLRKGYDIKIEDNGIIDSVSWQSARKGRRGTLTVVKKS